MQGAFSIRIPPFHQNWSTHPPALAHSWARGRLWRIYPRRVAGNRTAGAGRKGQAAAKRRVFHPLTARPRPCTDNGGDGGYTPPEPFYLGIGHKPWDKVSRSRVTSARPRDRRTYPPHGGWPPPECHSRPNSPWTHPGTPPAHGDGRQYTPGRPHAPADG